MESVSAVVVAAGAGLRLGGAVPKALQTLGDRQFITHSVQGLAKGGVTHAVVVCYPGREDEYRQALKHSPIPYRLAPGGAERQDSVANGLAELARWPETSDSAYILVHDAARALTPPSVVRRVVEALRRGAVGAIPVIDVVDTIRQLDGQGSTVIDRTRLRAVQTPQGFRREALFAAYDRLRTTGEQVTDDASAVEFLGHEITLVEGSREALKITTPIDVLTAEALRRTR
jgi:2-C-methyl-D-erythritol 4-phosphate cytidylyltransferase